MALAFAFEILTTASAKAFLASAGTVVSEGALLDELLDFVVLIVVSFNDLGLRHSYVIPFL